MKIRFSALLALVLCLATALCACKNPLPDDPTVTPPFMDGTNAGFGGNDDGFGEDLESSEIYDGMFDGDEVDVTVSFVSGSDGCYTLEGNVLTFTALSADSVYSVSGKLGGCIVIDVGEDYKLDLELCGLSIVSTDANPITVKSGDKVSVTAKKDTENYIYDKRPAVDENDTEAHSGAIHAECDLEICGKGKLTVVSDNNNGIHTKDDLEVKNLTLFVSCADNALKGNDSVTLESGTTTLIAKVGDGIKTSNSDVSSKGNQRGDISVLGGDHTVYAACDGLDASHDVLIEGDDTSLKVYTDKYSNYSEEVTATDSDNCFIRFSSKNYSYSVKYYNSDEDFVWVNAEYHSSVSGGRSNYYYYSYPRMSNYSKLQIFIYDSTMEQGQDQNYLASTDLLTFNEGYDTLAISSRGSSLSYSWTNYTTQPNDFFGGGPGGMGGGHGGMGGGPGGMGGGNTEKSDHSTKGIKAANEITVNGGTVTVKSYDDAIHANADTALENGSTPTGNVTINGGTLSVYSNDDGLHADGTLIVNGGSVNVSHSYEGLEGSFVKILGGSVSVVSSDDGINATATTGTATEISGGGVYVFAGGDGIDSNSRTSYSGIVFSGGYTVVISTSGGNSAIDSEQGYKYTAGYVLAVMPSGGMTQEATHCQNFSSVATSASISSGEYVTVTVGSDTVLTVRLPRSISGRAIFLGSSSAKVTTSSSSNKNFDSNGVLWE